MTFKSELAKLLKKHNKALLSYIKLGELSNYKSQTLQESEVMDYGYAKEHGYFIHADLVDKPSKQENIEAYKKEFQTFTFKEFISPVDGKRIASTKQLRDHERQHGMKQCGNDFNNIIGKNYGHSE
jgi:hypothetical protein